jgi:DNA-binding NarL/FixJ family response regulator
MMPLRDGVAATVDILAEDPDARILVLTSATDDERVLQALAAGAHGYLVKEAERSQLLEGVRRVAEGDLYLPASTTGKLVRALQHGKPSEPLPVITEPVLSQRQKAVLALAAAGLNDEQIAGRLMVSETTVRVHFHHLMVKLGAPDRAAAIAWYAEQQRR